MTYRNTDEPDSTIVKLSLSIGQMKVLEYVVSAELGDVERGYANTNEKTLQTLCDVLWKHLHIKLTPEEEAAKLKPFRDACRAGNEAMQAHLAASRGEGMGDE